MFNHARTLLLNDHGSNAPGYGLAGEEAVPLEFRAFVVPAFLASVRRVLFGSNPDRLMMNYRLRQFMAVLHSTELVEHVLELDPRITYDPAATDLFEHNFGITVEGTDRPFFCSGTPGPDDSRGRLLFAWRVSIGSGNQVTVFRETVPPAEQTTTFTVEDGLSSPVTLGQDLLCSFDPTAGNTWFVTATARPNRDLPAIVEALRNSVGGPYMTQLFGEVPVEPYKTFANLWNDHHALPYRLGGLLLAAVYRSHEAWRKEV